MPSTLTDLLNLPEADVAPVAIDQTIKRYLFANQQDEVELSSMAIAALQEELIHKAQSYSEVGQMTPVEFRRMLDSLNGTGTAGRPVGIDWDEEAARRLYEDCVARLEARRELSRAADELGVEVMSLFRTAGRVARAVVNVVKAYLQGKP